MATIEKTGLLKFVGEDGQIYVLYPATKAAQVEGLEELLGTKMSESLSGKYAPLDASGKVVLDYLYTNTANALAKLDASGKLPVNLIPALSAYIAATAKGAANGVASLDATGKLPSGQLTEHGHAYSDITDKPSTFPPASHSHAVGDISGVLPVSKGGTGASSLSSLATELGRTKELETVTKTTADWGTVTASSVIDVPFETGCYFLFVQYNTTHSGSVSANKYFYGIACFGSSPYFVGQHNVNDATFTTLSGNQFVVYVVYNDPEVTITFQNNKLTFGAQQYNKCGYPFTVRYVRL